MCGSHLSAVCSCHSVLQCARCGECELVIWVLKCESHMSAVHSCHRVPECARRRLQELVIELIWEQFGTSGKYSVWNGSYRFVSRGGQGRACKWKWKQATIVSPALVLHKLLQASMR